MVETSFGVDQPAAGGGGRRRGTAPWHLQTLGEWPRWMISAVSFDKDAKKGMTDRVIQH